MTDLAGKTISHYNILEKIGEGGMGVVFKARDSKLNRTVALKFLHPHQIADQKKRARFFLEAQAAASLNHPNICTIHSIEETTTDDRQIFIAMEYIEGQNLQQKIAAGSFKFQRALDIAIQIAEGLCEAHSKGVIHRDIKPSNIMVVEKGQVKITDFGLARLTRGVKITKDGKTLGTVAYISPEQARGEEVDQRSDIWSLGVVLYEMIAGKLPFEGENEVAMLIAVLNNEPKPISEWRNDVPAELEKIIFKCLAKEKDYRYQATDQLWNDFKKMKQPIDSFRDNAQPFHRPRRIKVSTKKTAGFVLATILFIAMLVLISHFGLFQKQITTPRIIKTHALTRTIDIFEAGSHISPDGSRIAYNSDESGNLDLWVLHIASGQKRNLTKDYEGFDSGGKWSPDGNWLAFISSREGGGIYIISEYGGAARQVVANDPKNLGRFRWSPDGFMLAYTVQETLYTVPIKGGIPERVPLTHGCIDPDWSPDGSRIVYITGKPLERQIWTVQPDGSDSIVVIEKPGRYQIPTWSPDGKRIFFKNIQHDIRELWWMPVDKKGKPTAAAKLLQVGVNFYEFSLSHDGSKLIFLGGEGTNRTFNIWSILLDTDQVLTIDDAVRITSEIQDMGHLAISVDHEWFAYTSPRGGTWDIWLVRRNGQDLRQLTADSSYEGALSWSPDGSRIAFHGPRPFHGDIYIIPVTGGPATTLISRPNRGYFPVWSPDGEKIAYNSDQSGNWDVWAVSVNNREVRQLTNNKADEAFPCWSPDCRTIAFASNQSGAGEIHLIPAEGGEAKQLTHTLKSVEAMRPIWSPDGKTIYTTYDPGKDDAGRKIAAVSVADGSVRKIFESKKPYFQGPDGDYPSLATDGERLFFIAGFYAGDIMLAELVYE
ncbi:serine/threonine-protein kinase [candidate division KSB1 bacterium]|nr:serine/threonine-protein kinase [candidate division KSB1 bacterium]